MKKLIIKILEWEARVALWRRRPYVIAITGSVGKTGTKDALYAMLKNCGMKARCNEKSYNSEFGVPLAILGLKSAWSSPSGWLRNIVAGFYKSITYNLIPNTYPDYLVLEMGADRPGDIKKLAAWVRPQIGVITGFGNEVPVHVEFFDNIDTLVKEKGELLVSLPRNGVAVINRDDARAWDMREFTKANILTYGFHQEARIRGDNLRISYEGGVPKGMNLRVDYAGKSVPVRLCGVLGLGVAYNSLAAFAVGVSLGLNVVEIAAGLESRPPTPGRMRLLRGMNGSIIIDDTYNSSPAAVKLALATLHELNLEPKVPSGTLGSRKIAVLGDMMELGAYEVGEHTKVGGWIRGVADVLVVVGERARIIGESAITDGFARENVYFFPDSISAGKFFVSDFGLHPSDIILLKASQSIRLERATELLLADPSKAGELLVRQEREWKKR